MTCVAFSIKFAKTNQKFAENSEFCEKNSLLLVNYSLRSLVEKLGVLYLLDAQLDLQAVMEQGLVINVDPARGKLSTQQRLQDSLLRQQSCAPVAFKTK